MVGKGEEVDSQSLRSVHVSLWRTKERMEKCRTVTWKKYGEGWVE